MSVLITGASRGIGRATAVELSRRGHHVIATARHIEALSDLTTGARLRLDVTDQPSLDAAIAAAGQIDVLSRTPARHCAPRWNRCRCTRWNACSSSTPSARCG